MTAYQLFPEDNILTMDAAKPCTSCGVVYPLSHYHKNARAKDGREHRCPKCRNKGGLQETFSGNCFLEEDFFLSDNFNSCQCSKRMENTLWKVDRLCRRELLRGLVEKIERLFDGF